MKKQKLKEQTSVNTKKIRKRDVYYTEEQQEIKRLIIIVLVLFIVVGAVYFITDHFIEKGSNETTIPGEINYDVASIGTLLNRPYNEYYAVLYNKEDVNSSYYSSIISTYNENNSNEEDYIKIYYIDLGKKINSDYYNINNDFVSNPKAKSISELDLGNITLLRIKNGQIIEYIEDISKINELLS